MPGRTLLSWVVDAVVATDYAVFLLSSAKEHYEHTGEPKHAVTSALAHSGRVILAAAAVTVAILFTFALADLAVVAQTGGSARRSVAGHRDARFVPAHNRVRLSSAHDHAAGRRRMHD
jgi:MMPL family